MLSPAEAATAIRTHASALPAVATPLAQLSGAILREDIVSARDQPPFDRVMMDGVAFSMAAWDAGRRSFQICGTQGAGAAPLTLRAPDDCIEIMTGASLPHGCDCVIPVEKITVRDGVAHVADDAAPARGLNIHPRGLDVSRGDRLLQAGTRLGPAEVAVIASNGLTHVQATRAPRIVVISTGDELVEPGGPVEDWQIYRSNAYGVLAALRERGFGQLAHDHLPDDPEILRRRLGEHLEQRDVLILSGGVSMGRYDYVPQVLGELGVKVVFHKIAQRPGKPMWFGVGPAGQTVYALPGNPVSTLVCLIRYVVPGLAATLGTIAPDPSSAVLDAPVDARSGLTGFMPVKLSWGQGVRRAQPHPTRGSGDFTSLIGTDGFLEIPPGPAPVERGASLAFYSW